MFGSAFHYGRDLGEIEASLDTLKAQGADFVKIYLTGSENYEAPNDDGSPNSTTGLNPDNIAGLVELAHARDLPVMAHIETRTDFAVAVDAGVDFLAHLPGYGGISEDEIDAKTLTADDISAAAASGIGVVPTYAIAAIRFEDALTAPDLTEERRVNFEARRELTFAIQKANLQGLHDAGVPILLGTDLFPGGGSHMEMRHWVELGALTPIEAARQSFQTGPLLFPDEKIACLSDGCFADFLVLEANPAEDLIAFDSIAMRIKSGAELIKPDSADG